jgi:hypothetical protein
MKHFQCPDCGEFTTFWLADGTLNVIGNGSDKPPHAGDGGHSDPAVVMLAHAARLIASR